MPRSKARASAVTYREAGVDIDAGDEQKGTPGNPSISLSGGNSFNGCDPFEPRAGRPIHYSPPCDANGAGASCDNTTYSVPFVPADTTPGDPA